MPLEVVVISMHVEVVVISLSQASCNMDHYAYST
jgi:hypothetical protein